MSVPDLQSPTWRAGQSTGQEDCLELSAMLAVEALAGVLLDFPLGTTEQATAWQRALEQLSPAIQANLPPFSRLMELAGKAWPATAIEARRQATDTAPVSPVTVHGPRVGH